MAASNAPLRVVKLEAENIKRIKAISITPQGDIVEIAGNNGQGKSSTLDCISLALEGNARGVERPVRNGQVSGRIVLDLGEYVVTRHWTPDGPPMGYLKVATKDGSKPAKPQTFLDALIGTIAFEPDRFCECSPKDRRTELLRLVKVGIDLDAHASKLRGAKERRAEAFRAYRDLQGALASRIEVPGEVEPEVSVAELAAEMQRGSVHNMECDRLAGLARNAEADHAAKVHAVARLKAELHAAELAEAQALQVAKEARTALHDSRPIALSEIKDRMLRAEEANAAIRTRNTARRERAQIQAQHDAAINAHTTLDSDVAELEAERTAALAEADFPIDGLSIGEEDVELAGVPFGDLSDSERYDIALKLALAANPRLRVALLRRASLYDAGRLRQLAQWAHDNDVQVWQETVGDGGDGAFVIEDGAIVAAEVAS